MSTPAVQQRTVRVYESWGPTVLRVGIGAAMMVNGAGKVFAWGPRSLGIDAFAGYLAILGFPAPVAFAWLAALAEFVGGALILLGLFTRVAALLVGLTMTVAMTAVHMANGFPLFMEGTAYTVGEYTFVLIAGSLALIFMGAGNLSLERALWGREFLVDQIARIPGVTTMDELEAERRRPA